MDDPMIRPRQVRINRDATLGALDPKLGPPFFSQGISPAQSLARARSAFYPALAPSLCTICPMRIPPVR